MCNKVPGGFLSGMKVWRVFLPPRGVWHAVRRRCAQAALIEMGVVPARTLHVVRAPNVTLSVVQRGAALDGLRALRFFAETARGPHCGDGLVSW